MVTSFHFLLAFLRIYHALATIQYLLFRCPFCVCIIYIKCIRYCNHSVHDRFKWSSIAYRHIYASTNMYNLTSLVHWCVFQHSLLHSFAVISSSDVSVGRLNTYLPVPPKPLEANIYIYIYIYSYDVRSLARITLFCM